MYNLVMRKPNIIPRNYNNNINGIQLVLPLDIEILLPKDDSVTLLSQVLEEIDASILTIRTQPCDNT